MTVDGDILMITAGENRLKGLTGLYAEGLKLALQTIKDGCVYI